MFKDISSITNDINVKKAKFFLNDRTFGLIQNTLAK